jgi:hypothetical protein
VRLILLVILTESLVAGDTDAQCDQTEKQQSWGGHANILPGRGTDGGFSESGLSEDQSYCSLFTCRRGTTKVWHSRPGCVLASDPDPAATSGYRDALAEPTSGSSNGDQPYINWGFLQDIKGRQKSGGL